jgi:hypothetical protein
VRERRQQVGPLHEEVGDLGPGLVGDRVGEDELGGAAQLAPAAQDDAGAAAGSRRLRCGEVSGEDGLPERVRCPPRPSPAVAAGDQGDAGEQLVEADGFAEHRGGNLVVGAADRDEVGHGSVRLGPKTGEDLLPHEALGPGATSRGDEAGDRRPAAALGEECGISAEYR